MKTTNILTTLFFIYLICLQNVLNANNFNKKIGSNSTQLKHKAKTDSTSHIYNSQIASNYQNIDSEENSTSIKIQLNQSKKESENQMLNLVQTSNTATKNKIQISNLLKLSSQLFQEHTQQNGASATEGDVATSESTFRNNLKSAAFKYKLAGSCVKGILNAFPASFCAKNGGDVGVPPTECVNGWVRQAAMCYKACDSDYDLVVGVCWKKCKQGYKNIGWACFKKPFLFYFKRSYVTKAATNFDTQSICRKGLYKFGALCYRDCNNISMINCGVGYCAMDKKQCDMGIASMSIDISYGIMKAILFIMTFGASTATTTQINAAKVSVEGLKTSYVNSLYTSMQTMLKKIMDSSKSMLTKSYLRSKINEKSSKEFMMASGKQLSGVSVAAIVGTVCNQVALNLFFKQTESEQKATSSYDYIIFDIFGYFKAAIACDGDLALEGNKVLCADAIIGIFQIFDPTGLLTIASAFLSPICDVPGKIQSYEPDDGCVRFYDEPDYESSYHDACANSQNYLEIFGKRASSMKLSETIELYVWSGENFTGQKYFFDAYTFIYDLDLLSLEDSIGSFQIIYLAARENCLVVYDQCNYKGNSYQYCESNSDVVNKLNNLRIKSAITGVGKGVYFYIDVAYKGTALYKLMDESKIACFDSTNLGTNQIKSFNLIPMANVGCVKFFKGCDLTGDSVEICANTANNNYASYQSLVIGSNTQVTVQPLTNYGGVLHNLLYSLNIRCLKDFLNVNSLGMFNQVSFQSFIISKTLPSDGCIVVFEIAEFKGRAKEICESDRSFEFNDSYKLAGKFESFSSLIVGKNVQILQLFSEDYYKGTSVDLLNDIDLDIETSEMQFENLGQFDFDKLTKSIKLITKINKNCVVVFENAYYKGKRTELCGEKVSLTSTTALKFNSLIIKDLMQFSLYTTSDYKTMFKLYNGYLEVFSESSEFTGKSFLAYELETLTPKDNCINIFPETNFQGKVQKICTSITDFSSYSSKILSFKVAQNLREAMFFSNLSYTGTRYSVSVEIIDTTKWNYANTNLNVNYNVAFSTMKSLFLIPAAPNAGCVKFYQKTYFIGDSVTFCESQKIYALFGTIYYDTFYGNLGSMLIGDDTQFYAKINTIEYYITEKNFLTLKSVETTNGDDFNTVTVVNLENIINKFRMLDLKNIPDRDVLFYRFNYYQGRATRITHENTGFMVIGSSQSFTAGSLVREIRLSKNSGTDYITWTSGKNSNKIYSIYESHGSYENFDNIKIIPYADANCVYIFSDIENLNVCKNYSKLDENIYQGKTFTNLFNKTSTSIVTAESTVALLFSAENYTGSMKKINSLGINTSGFVEAGNPSRYPLFSSIIISYVNQGCVRIYTTKNLDGTNNSSQHCTSIATLNGAFNQAASLIVGSEIYRIVIYSGENYTGTTKELTVDSQILDLSVEHFTVIESIMVIPLVGNDCVLLNNQCNFLGKSIQVCGSFDKISAASDELINFSIKSVMVGTNYQARFYEKENYDGRYISLSYEIGKNFSSCITDASKENVNYTINSILLTNKTPKFNCFMVFENCNFTGERFEVCYDIASGLSTKIPKISSIKTGSSTEITIWDNENFTKRTYNSVILAKNDLTNQICLTSNTTIANAQSIKMNINTDEIRLSDEKCLKVFSRCNYNGSSMEICSDIANKSLNSVLANFPIASFKLGSIIQVNFWEQNDYAGSTAIYSRSISKISSACVATDFIFEINSMQLFSDTPKSTCILLFYYSSFAGKRYELCQNNPDLSSITFRSFKIGSLMKVYFYREKNYATEYTSRINFTYGTNVSLIQNPYLSVGISRDLNAPQTSISTYSVGSLENLDVENVYDPSIINPEPQPECYIVFSECDYKGNSFEYCEANGNIKEIIERVSSVIVGKNILVSLFDEFNFAGNSINLAESTSYRCLDEFNFYDITDSVSISIVDLNKFY